MKLELLYPTPIAFFDLAEPITAKELKYMKSKTLKKNEFNTSSEDSYLLENLPMKRLKAEVLKCVNAYAHDVWRITDKTELRITQSWLNVTREGQAHHKHAHPNSMFSGVLYIKTESERDRIVFYNDNYKTLRPEYVEYKVWNSDSWWFPVTQGQIVLFPSSLVHSVDLVGAGCDRVSLAFNTFPSNVIGEFNGLTELKL